MIEKIKIKNFLSFKDEVVFSFEASKDSFAEGSQVVKINEDVRLLRFAVVYGYNASGKSNLLKAFEFLRYFWNHKPNSIEDPIGVVPFKLDGASPQEHSFFELVFWVKGTKYKYQLELDSVQVYSEKLFCYNTSRPLLVFERMLEGDLSVIRFGPSLKIDEMIQRSVSVNCLKNTSLFVARKQVNAVIPLLDDVGNWIKLHLMQGILPVTNLTRYAQKKCEENVGLTDWLLEFLHQADFNITGISTNAIEEPLSDEVMEFLSPLPPQIQERINRGEPLTMRRLRTLFEHTVENAHQIERYSLSVEEGGREEESRGTMRTFGLESALYTAIKGDSFLTIDEIETSLHPKLLEKILFEYLRAESESQLIVTTHNDGLLDLVGDLLRKDSVWFTEKDGAGVTDLYKLNDFRGVNRLSSIREAYRNKRFGATMR